MSKLYNPPSNWPAPPEGWIPPPGWEPDAAWGPAPEGWAVWQEEPAKKRSWFARHKILTGIGALVLLSIFINALGGNKGNDEASRLAGANTSASIPTTEATATVAPAAPAKAAPAPKPVPKPVAKPVPKPVVLSFSGTGSDVVKFKKPISDAMLITTSWTGGDGNNTIYSLDSSGGENDLLVNTIGSYQGSSIINKNDGEATAALKIEGAGRWKVTLKPITEAKQWDGTEPLSGASDDVLVVKGVFTGLDSLKFTSTRADGNITVYGLGDNEELIVNDIGNFSGKYLVPEGIVLFQISSDGHWNLSKV